MEELAKGSSNARASDTKVIEDKNFDATQEDEQQDKKEGESSPARCPICLTTPTNRSKSESCSHYFCFSCLKEWSKVKAECPLCKVPFQTIFYNIKSDKEFDEYRVTSSRLGMSDAGLHRVMSANSIESLWRFQFLEHRHRGGRENEDAAREASSNVGAIRWRRMLYWNRVRVTNVHTGNRVRDISAEFFRENPSQMHRLEPWLRRELNVLYGAHNKALIRCVRDKIIAATIGIGITSRGFINMLQPYLLEHTDQFVHEFISFAKSPYDIRQYDRHSFYNSSRNRQRTRGQEPTAPDRNSSFRPRRSRWDDSPDVRENPAGPTSQSVMLSQTSWDDDTASPVSIPQLPITLDRPLRYSVAPEPAYAAGDFTSHDSYISDTLYPTYDISGSYTPRPYVLLRNMEAPLMHQTIDVHRTAGSSARQYGRMEIMRRHFDQHTRRRSGARLHRAQQQTTLNAVVPQEVIVISSDSSDAEPGTSNLLAHDNPSTSQTVTDRPVQDRGIKQEKSDESYSTKSSDSQTESDGNDIEFVKYIKPPHLRTPDIFIELSSTDDDAPGPSTRISSNVTKAAQKYDSGSSSSSSDSESDERGRLSRSAERPSPSNTLQRTKEFLQKVRESSGGIKETHCCSDQHAENSVNAVNESQSITGAISDHNTECHMEDGSNEVSDFPISNKSSGSSLPANKVLSTVTSVVPLDTGTSFENVPLQSAHQSKQLSPSEIKNVHPKKVFERGKVSVNFSAIRSDKCFDASESDSDIDVGIEVMPAHLDSYMPFAVNEVVEGDPRDNDERRLRDQAISNSEDHPRTAIEFNRYERCNGRTEGSMHRLHEVNKNYPESFSHRSTHKAKKKRKHSSRHDSRGKHSLGSNYGDRPALSPPYRRLSCENYEVSSQHHSQVEKRHKKHHKLKKSHKRSKRRKRSKSSSVEFVSQIY